MSSHYTADGMPLAFHAGGLSSFLLYLHKLILVNVKIEIKAYVRITFQCCTLY